MNTPSHYIPIFITGLWVAAIAFAALSQVKNFELVPDIDPQLVIGAGGMIVAFVWATHLALLVIT